MGRGYWRNTLSRILPAKSGLGKSILSSEKGTGCLELLSSSRQLLSLTVQIFLTWRHKSWTLQITFIIWSNLAPLVGQPLLNVTDLELRVDTSRNYAEKQLVPMIGMIWKLARFIDDCIHVQEAAGACSVGYTQYYQYKNTQVFGNEMFSGSKADKEFWTHDTLDTEKEILKMQPHHRLVANSGGRLPKVLSGTNSAQKD